MNMKSTALLSAMLLLAVPAAHAWEPSFTPAITSDYDFRGITLTARKPALQLSFDVAADNGFSAGVWISNVDFGVPGVDVEVDYTLGWSGDGGAVSWNSGVAYYSYPNGSDLNYPEAWFGLGKSFNKNISLEAKLWYSSDYAGAAEAATYFETNATFGLPFGGVDLSLHAGYSSGDYWDTVNDQGYIDYSIGIGKRVARWDLALSFIDGSDLPDTPGTDLNSTEKKFVLSVATSLPWK
jgi:uncharacterized protein (TIGR02001 family)